MNDNTILIVGAVGLGMMYMMSQRNQQAQPQSPIYIPVPQPSPGGYANQQPKPTTGQKIVNTIETGKSIFDAGKGLFDTIFGNKTNGINFVPSVMPRDTRYLA